MDSGEAPVAGEVTRFYPPRLRLLLLAGGCGFVALVSVLPTYADFALIVGVGWASVGVCGLAGLVLLARALRPGPTVLVDDRGITDRTTLSPAGLIPWQDITVLRKREIGRGMGAERLLEVLLTDEAAFHGQRRGWLRRLIERYRRLLRQPVVSIPASMVSVPMQVVVDTVRRRRPELDVLQGPPPAPSKFRWGQPPESRRRHPDLPRW